MGSRCPREQCDGGVGGRPAGHDHCHRVAVLVDWPSLVVRRGGRREVNFGLVLIPTLSSAIFGRVFSFDHGQFGACRDANIGMKPKAPPLERR